MAATKFFALGGMLEIGKSCMVVEHKDEIVIMDAGIKFVNSMVTGADGIVPDYTYLKDNQEKIKGLFITHGHEDHIGGIPYLLQQVDVKRIYAPQIAIEYIKARLQDKGVKADVEYIAMDTDLVAEFDEVKVDFWTTQHSIPDSFGIRVRTPNGAIMDTGDFRIDYTPLGNLTDFTKLEKWGEEGIDILISDSTNSMSPNHSPTERKILEDIEKIIKEAKGKVLFTTFASNINRVHVVLELAKKHKKKVCVFGRSMVNAIKVIQKLNMFDIPPGLIIDKKEIHKFPDNELLVVTTGSQGEDLAALNRIALGKHAQLNLQKGDVVIFSSSPIPGNRMKIELLINRIYRAGGEARENKIDGMLHTSGHAYQEEHSTIFKITKPKYFVPYHGAYRQSAVHGQTAILNGVKEDNVIIIDNGEIIELENHVAKVSKEVIDPGPIYIDGGMISKTTSESINMRAKLGENGFINVIAVIDKKKNEIVGRTRIMSRGAIYTRESRDIMDEVQRLAHGGILFVIKNNKEWTKKDIKEVVSKRVGQFFYKTKRRNPFILTSIVDKSAKGNPNNNRRRPNNKPGGAKPSNQQGRQNNKPSGKPVNNNAKPHNKPVQK